MVYVIVFFFKQKTAYEMRISDWSSDVCSSDLDAVPGEAQGRLHREARVLARLLERDPRAGARVLRRLHRVLVGPVGQRHARAEGQGVHLHRLRHRCHAPLHLGAQAPPAERRRLRRHRAGAHRGHGDRRRPRHPRAPRGRAPPGGGGPAVTTVAPEGSFVLTDEAVRRFREALGDDAVVVDEAGRDEYRDPYWLSEDRTYDSSAVLYPSSTEEVQAVVRIANELDVPLWTSSQGRNNGYGGAAPPGGRTAPRGARARSPAGVWCTRRRTAQRAGGAATAVLQRPQLAGRDEAPCP